MAPLLAGGAAAQQAPGGLAPQLPAGPLQLGGIQPGQGAAGSVANQNLEALLEAAVQSSRPGTLVPVQQVGPDGAISIPYAGRIVVAGHTTTGQLLDNSAETDSCLTTSFPRGSRGWLWLSLLTK